MPMEGGINFTYIEMPFFCDQSHTRIYFFLLWFEVVKVCNCPNKRENEETLPEVYRLIAIFCQVAPNFEERWKKNGKIGSPPHPQYGIFGYVIGYIKYPLPKEVGILKSTLMPKWVLYIASGVDALVTVWGKNPIFW